MTDYEKYSLIIQGVSYLILAGGLIIAIAHIRQLKKQRQEEHEWNRRSKAFEYSFIEDPEVFKALTRLDGYLEINTKKSSEIELEKIEELSTSEYPEIKNDIHFVLARLENMCTAMRHSVADEQICRNLFENRVVSFFRFFRQYVEDIRKRRDSDKVFRNLEHYANKRWVEKDHIRGKPPTG